MTTIDWPLTLPYPSTLSGDTASPVIRTQMDSGYTRQRSRFGSQVKTRQLSWVFTEAEFATFKEFFRDTLQGGTLWFNMVYPDGEGGFTSREVRFVGGRFTEQYVPFMQWQVGASIEEQVQQVITFPEPDIMPLLYQRVQEKTENYTLQFTDLNSLITANPGEGEEIIITLPLNAGFTTKFSCGVVNIGLGAVRFAGETGVVADSVNGYLRVFQRFTPVTITYIGVNRFLLMGSLY